MLADTDSAYGEPEASFKEGIKQLFSIADDISYSSSTPQRHENVYDGDDKEKIGEGKEREREKGKDKEREDTEEDAAGKREVTVGDACAVLGLLYEEGLSLPQDRKTAFRYVIHPS